ncbi:hypothetical protein [Pseudoxanthomonas sp. CF125]|uniref:hypothetical protein n=1 Tax=Pseudoxanthomonas sp. CF125 TaxID=1855303 RepID=UPI002100EC48|nr:hypothetical protein [Pseudoxanthomonas sp. CF125]
MLPLPLLAQVAGSEEKLDASRMDLAALIECRQTLADFHYLAPALADPLQAVALGWRPLPQANLFMTEFVLNKPVSVFGHSTDHIAFAGDSIIALLDLPDPRPLAKQLELETAIDTPAKAMFGKEVSSTEEHDQATGTVYIKSAVLNVSNVASHPGKTLVGCSYSLDRAEDPEPMPAADTIVP